MKRAAETSKDTTLCKTPKAKACGSRFSWPWNLSSSALPSSVSSCCGGPGAGLPAPELLSPANEYPTVSSPSGSRSEGAVALPQFPSHLGVRPSSLFRAAVRGESRSVVDGAPGGAQAAVRGRFRAIAFCQAHCFTAANISLALLLPEVHLANRGGPRVPRSLVRGGRAPPVTGVNLSSQLKSL